MGLRLATGRLGVGGRVDDRVGAVSYTHLRAHETVLDLVCRLLLEKKKHHRDNDNPATSPDSYNTLLVVLLSQENTPPR